MIKNEAYGKKLLTTTLMILVSFLLIACGSGDNPDGDEGLPAQAVLDAQSWLASQLNVPVEEVNLVSSEQVEWTDSCLGLGGPAESCLAAMTPGWQAAFEVQGQAYEVRVDETGDTIRSPQISNEPPAIEE